MKLREFGGEEMKGQVVGSGGTGRVTGQEGEWKRTVEEIGE